MHRFCLILCVVFENAQNRALKKSWKYFCKICSLPMCVNTLVAQCLKTYFRFVIRWCPEEACSKTPAFVYNYVTAACRVCTRGVTWCTFAIALLFFSVSILGLLTCFFRRKLLKFVLLSLKTKNKPFLLLKNLKSWKFYTFFFRFPSPWLVRATSFDRHDVI